MSVCARNCSRARLAIIICANIIKSAGATLLLGLENYAGCTIDRPCDLVVATLFIAKSPNERALEISHWQLIVILGWFVVCGCGCGWAKWGGGCVIVLFGGHQQRFRLEARPSISDLSAFAVCRCWLHCGESMLRSSLTAIAWRVLCVCVEQSNLKKSRCLCYFTNFISSILQASSACSLKLCAILSNALTITLRLIDAHDHIYIIRSLSANDLIAKQERLETSVENWYLRRLTDALLYLSAHCQSIVDHFFFLWFVRMNGNSWRSYVVPMHSHALCPWKCAFVVERQVYRMAYGRDKEYTNIVCMKMKKKKQEKNAMRPHETIAHLLSSHL